MSNADIVVAGNICLDISPELGSSPSQRIETLLRPGRLIHIDGVTVSTGGQVANTGFALARLGMNVLPIACIGFDEFGSIVAAITQRETGRGILQRDALRTSYSVILSPPGIDRIILHDPAGNDTFRCRDIDFSQVKKAGYFHFGYPPLMKNIYADGGEELLKIFHKAKQSGAITSLDMALPDVDSDSGKVDWASIIEEVLPDVDVFMPSIEELLFMLDRAEYERVLANANGDDCTLHLSFDKVRYLGAHILSLGSAIAMIKCGSNGLYIKTAGTERMELIGKCEWANQELFSPTYHAQDFKSALAGGDTTAAGFLSGMIRKYSLLDCTRLACQTGALCCTTYDAISALVPLEEIYAMVQAQPKQNETQLPKGAMRFNEKERMYIV